MQIDDWLAQLGLEGLSSLFHENGVDLPLLAELTNDDLKDMGIVRLRDRKVILKAIDALQSDSGDDTEPPVIDQQTAALQPTPVQRRQLTVMFCDLVGSTALSTRFDPEDLRELLTAFQETCRKAILQYNGFIARYMGDGILVYFGYPVAMEDSPERAVRAGLEILQSMQTLNAGTGKRYGVELEVRIGVATGSVLVGDMHIGQGAAEEAGVVGETPNLAARLQSIAQPNQLVVSSATRQLLGVLFDYDDLGQHELKGINGLVTAWGVTGQREVESRYSATRAGRKTPLVGRQDELNVLLTRWQTCRQNGGQVVLLSGEAGIGKSRLCEALEERLAEEGHRRILMQCSPFHENSALYPVLEFFRQELALDLDANPETNFASLDKLLAGYSIDGVPLATLAAPLLSIPVSDELSHLNPGQRKKLMFEGTIKGLQEYTTERPLVVLIEDAHWIDPTTLELLDAIVAQLRDIRMLLVITHRPNFQVSWANEDMVVGVRVSRLPSAQVHELVERLAEDHPLPGDQLRDILSKTDGIPLFVEEMTKMLQERAAGSENHSSRSGDSSQIPNTIQGLLLARLDQLGDTKWLAQQAACFGRYFTRDHLSILTGVSVQKLQPQLDQLVASGLVDEEPDNDGHFQFKHALVQEAAYSSQLRNTRVEIHGKIAESLEPELAEHDPEVLAHHFSQARMFDKSVPYWQAAGAAAMGTSALVEACAYYNKALEQLPELPESSARDEQELMLLLGLGDPLVATRGFAATEVSDTFNRARDICRTLENVDLLFPVLWGLISFYIVRSDFKNSLELGTQFQSLATASGSDDLMMTGDYLVAASEFWCGNFQVARAPLERFVQHADPETNIAFQLAPTESPLIDTQSYMAWLQWLSGSPDKGMQYTHRCIALARSHNNYHDLAYALGFAAWCCHLRREYHLVGEFADELMTVASEQEFPHWLAAAMILKGSEVVRAGDIEAGIAQIDQGLEIWQMTGALLLTPSYQQVQAEAYLTSGQLDKAMELINTSLDMVEETGERVSESELRRFKAEVHERSGDIEAAREQYKRAIDIAYDQGAKILELRSLVALGKLDRQHAAGHAGDPDIDPRIDPRIESLLAEFTEGLDTPDVLDAREYVTAR